MYRGQQSNTEGDDIWHEKGKYRGTLQSQQLQMATERGSLVGITAAKEVCSLKNPHLVMHLSMEDLILFQSDLIWENCIVSAYKSYHPDDSLPLSHVPDIKNYTFIPRKSSASGSHILYGHSAELPKTSLGVVGFSNASHYNFNAQKQGQVKEIIWTSYVQGAIAIKNLWRKRKLRAQLDDAESRAKRSLNLNRCGDSLPYLMNFNDKTNIDFISYFATETKHQDRFVKPCHNLEAFSEKNTSMYMLRSAQETYCNVKPGSKICDDGCYYGSVLKSLVISSSSLGATEEVFSSTFIPQTDRSVDYTMLCGSLLQKGRCKVPAESDESLCLTNNTDSNINLHVRLSVHPSTLTSDVILSDINYTQPCERQGQNCFNRASCERRRMQAEMADAANTLKSTQKNKSLLSCIDKKNRHCGNNDKSILAEEKPFPTQLNYPLAKLHFRRDINFSILAASLLRTSKNDFSFLCSSGLQSASQTESSCEMTDESFPLKHEGLKYEQAEAEVSLGIEDINNSGGRANLDDKSALSKQDFCFPSHFQNGVDNEQSEKETSGNDIDFYMESVCLKQVSCTESFQKVCLEKCLVEAKSSNSEETYSSFWSEMLFYKSRSREDNVTTMEDKPTESKSKCLNIKQHKHPFYTKDTEDKESNETPLYGNINSDAAQNFNIGKISIGEKVMDKEVHITFSNLDDIEEENQHVKLDVLDRLLDSSPVSSVCVETTGNSKQICDQVNEIKIETSPAVTEENTDASKEGSQVLLKNTDFEMKAQFDLVLEELKMFHTIEEVKVEHFEIEQWNRLKDSCSNAREQDKIKENFPSNKVTVGSDSEVLVMKKDNICERKILAEVIEQEVPQHNMPSYQGDEESLYSADNIEDAAKSLPWTPAFLKRSDREENVKSYTEKAVTFSHGIGRVTPLKTRTGPLRIGLSKKAKIKQLHPYLR